MGGGGGAFGIKIFFFFYLGVKFGAEYAQSNFKEDFLLSLGKKTFSWIFWDNLSIAIFLIFAFLSTSKILKIWLPYPYALTFMHILSIHVRN